MAQTAFTRLVGASVPLQLAAMPDVGTVKLVAAVADAGALGMIGVPMKPPAAIEAAIDEIAALTKGVFGVNFLVPFLDPDGVDVAARRARLVEFFYGEPDSAMVARVHGGGAMVSWQVGSVGEAVAAEQAGCDFIVAQGTAAGGHVRGRTSLVPLLSRVLDAVKIPVVAAGGIGSRRDVAAVLAAGAAGARVGTRFVASAESGAHPSWVRALVAASAADTCLTEAFSVMWPHAPHRVLRSAVAAAEAIPDDMVGETRMGDRMLAVPRWSVIAPSNETTGRVEAMALYAGESVEHVHGVQPAADIVAELCPA